MPPRGVKPGTKRSRQYEHIKDSQLEQGAGESRAEEIAARTGRRRPQVTGLNPRPASRR
jgi:hypothetical protein